MTKDELLITLANQLYATFEILQRHAERKTMSGTANEKPIRIQLKRTKGWRMPPNTVKVTRPGVFGNPFTVKGCRDAGYEGTDEQIANRCVEAFRVWLTSPHWRENWDGPVAEAARVKMHEQLPSLRGKNLACWCKPGSPCHADVLLELANQ